MFSEFAEINKAVSLKAISFTAKDDIAAFTRQLKTLEDKFMSTLFVPMSGISKISKWLEKTFYKLKTFL